MPLMASDDAADASAAPMLLYAASLSAAERCHW